MRARREISFDGFLKPLFFATHFRRKWACNYVNIAMLKVLGEALTATKVSIDRRMHVQRFVLRFPF